ncbi:hypothetical protein R5R35_003265 [Gryllus longicercus]
MFPAMAVLFLLCGAVLLTAPPARAANQLPQDWIRCQKTDPQLDRCLEGAVQDAIKKLAGGIPSLGIASIDPLQLSALEIGQGQGPISVNQKFSNIKVLGLSKAVLEKSRADLGHYTLSFDGAVTNDFEADYEMDGRILLLPVTGRGRCKLSFTNMKATLEPKGKEIQKNGKRYFDVTEFVLSIKSLDKMQVHFENLFNGDKALGDTMNTLMNENWRDLWGELRPAFEQTFGAVFHQITKRIFEKVPFDDVFLD